MSVKIKRLSDRQIQAVSDEYLQRFKSLDGHDIETDHFKADEILVSILTELGLTAIVEEYECVSKWYA
jgi:hypothetical protein